MVLSLFMKSRWHFHNVFDTTYNRAFKKIILSCFSPSFLPVVSLQFERAKSKGTEVKICITPKTLCLPSSPPPPPPPRSDTKEPVVILWCLNQIRWSILKLESSNVACCYKKKVYNKSLPVTNSEWFHFIIINKSYLPLMSYKRCESCSMQSLTWIHLIRFGCGMEQSCICSQRKLFKNLSFFLTEFWLTDVNYVKVHIVVFDCHGLLLLCVLVFLFVWFVWLVFWFLVGFFVLSVRSHVDFTASQEQIIISANIKWLLAFLGCVLFVLHRTIFAVTENKCMCLK